MKTNHGILLLAYLAIGLPLACVAAFFLARATALSLFGVYVSGTVQKEGRITNPNHAWRWVTIEADGQLFELELPMSMGRGLFVEPVPLSVGTTVEIVYLPDGEFLQLFPMADLIDRTTYQFTPHVVEFSGLEDSRWLQAFMLASLAVACLFLAARSRRRILSEPPNASDWP